MWRIATRPWNSRVSSWINKVTPVTDRLRPAWVHKNSGNPNDASSRQQVISVPGPWGKFSQFPGKLDNNRGLPRCVHFVRADWIAGVAAQPPWLNKRLNLPGNSYSVCPYRQSLYYISYKFARQCLHEVLCNCNLCLAGFKGRSYTVEIVPVFLTLALAM